MSSWHDPHFYSKKLPKPEELEVYFQCFKTSPELKESFFEYALNHPYTTDDNYYNRSAKFPSLSVGSRTGNNKNWINEGLKDLDASVDLSTSEVSLLGVKNYDYKKDCGRRLPALAITLEEEVKSKILITDAIKSLSFETIIKSSKDMSTFYNRANSFITNLQAHEIAQFKNALDIGGYIQSLSHMEILAKIKKIREALPTEPIYVLAKESLLDYLFLHCNGGRGKLEPNVFLLLEEYSRYGYTRNENKFDDFKSAIFTTVQMKGSQNFQLNWKAQRGNRQWTIYFSLLSELGLDIPSDPIESGEKIVPVVNQHPRWGTLL